MTQAPSLLGASQALMPCEAAFTQMVEGRSRGPTTSAVASWLWLFVGGWSLSITVWPICLKIT